MTISPNTPSSVASAATGTLPLQAQAVIDFWLAAGPEKWFRKDEAFDAQLRTTFFDAHCAAARREYGDWMGQPYAALALLILLDQYPRNSFRGTAHMYATDPLARQYAKRAIDAGFDTQVQEALRPFFYLPLMHSEELHDQEQCVALCQHLPGTTLHFAIEHRDIVAKFGRFPHRNPELLRETTHEEQAFLAAGGFAG